MTFCVTPQKCRFDRVHKAPEKQLRVSEWVSDCCLTPNEQSFSYIIVRTSNSQWNNDICFCTRPACLIRVITKLPNSELDLYSASSMKQQSLGRNFAPLRYIILILCQPIFAFSSYSCVLSGETANTNFIVFDLTWPGLKPTIYRNHGRHANHYTTDTVKTINIKVTI